MTKNHYVHKPEKHRIEKRRTFRLIGIIVSILVILVIGFVFFQQGQISSSRVPDNTLALVPDEISVESAFQEYQAGAYILDVRETGEWDLVHIPNTVNIPLSQLPNNLSKLPTDEKIIIICNSGNRSAAAVEYLLGAGFSLVTSVQGGIIEWANEGFPVVGVRP